MLRPAALPCAFLLLAAASPPHVPILARDLIVNETTPALVYTWRVAPEAALQPALFARLHAEALESLATTRAEAIRDRKASGFTQPYSSMTDWTLSYDGPRLIALVAQESQFTGGAHPNTGYRGLIWDKAAQRKIAFVDVFTDWANARPLLQRAACEALGVERKTRRRGAILSGDFDKCPPLDQATLVPFGDYGALRVIYSPYVAGPYAEGVYDLKLAWPEGVARFVRPQYRAGLFKVGN